MKHKSRWNKESMKVKIKSVQQERIQIPDEVIAFNIIAKTTGVGLDLYDKMLNKYPEHFPEEVARRNKWKSVPQEVKDAYFDECSKMRKELHKDLPPAQGIVAWMNNTEEHQKWDEAYSKIFPIEQQREKELHKKYFGPYGL